MKNKLQNKALNLKMEQSFKLKVIDYASQTTPRDSKSKDLLHFEHPLKP